MKHTPLFITFEGIDGSGKSTQIQRLAKRLEEFGIKPLVTREPGGTHLGEKIRELLLSENMIPRAETLLFFAARAEHVETKIRPALESGTWVLSDRFTDATYAYQVGGKGFSGAEVEALEAWTLGDLRPDGTVLFDLSPETAAARRAFRSGGDDRFERESVEFFSRVREAYLDRAKRHSERFLVVQAMRTEDDIECEIAAWVQKLVRRKGMKA